MTTDKIKRMLDACYLAKRIRELLPELPDGVTPAYIQYMDVIHSLQSGDSDVKVKVSDISDMLKLPRPGVTRTVKEMEKKGYLSKTISKEDARITYITLTEKGVGECDRSPRARGGVGQEGRRHRVLAGGVGGARPSGGQPASARRPHPHAAGAGRPGGAA